ncbi:MAG: S8 family serine peptidase [Aeromicrobium sp.]
MYLTRTLKSAGRRAAVAGVVLATALASTGSPAQANPIDDLLAQAEGILASAVPGQPLKIVVTTETSDAPKISTVKASSNADALQVILAALEKPSTIGVDMAHPISIDVSNDRYRSSQWALTLFGAETLWKKSTGKSVVVAVVDTGVSARHPDLYGRVLAGYDFVSPGRSVADGNGHGTHVAGIIAATARNGIGIAGLAYQAKILPVRVLNNNGEGDTAGVARGIIWAARHGANVINLSLGSAANDSAIQTAVSYAQSRNVVVVAAAGNEGCGLFGSPTEYPAAYSGVLGVGAISSDRRIASYSSCGNWVDVVAPGSGILSTMIASSNAGLGCTRGSLYCMLSGTSMATPYAAATAALEIARLNRSYRQSSIVSRLQSTATDQGASGRDNNYGNGLINPSRLLSGR